MNIGYTHRLKQVSPTIKVACFQIDSHKHSDSQSDNVQKVRDFRMFRHKLDIYIICFPLRDQES